MKCSECGGTGKVEFPMMSMNGDEYTGEWEQHECEDCKGTGEVQTNEEWFCQLSTEEKAKWIAQQCKNTLNEYINEDALSRTNYKFWENWLKEIHE